MGMSLGKCAELGLLYLGIGLDNDVTSGRIGDVIRHFLVHILILELIDEILFDFRNLILTLAICIAGTFLGIRILQFRISLRRDDLHSHDNAVRSRRNRQRSIADIGGLFTENRPQEALFRRKLGLALRRHLADENIARLDLGANANNTVGAEILQRVFRDIRDVARDLFRSDSCISRTAFKRHDVQ